MYANSHVPKKIVKHRAASNYQYEQIPIHCAQGVHEYTDQWLRNNLGQNALIVEMGAGSGALTARLTDSKFVVHPFDLDCTDWKFQTVRAKNTDCNDPSWPKSLPQNQPIDALIALELIEHLDSPKRFIQEAASALQSGKYLVISTPNLFSVTSLFKAVFKNEFFAFSSRARHESGHISPMPRFLIEEFLQESGFDIIHTQRAGSAEVGVLTNMLLRLAGKVLSKVRKESEGVGHELVQIVIGKKR